MDQQTMLIGIFIILMCSLSGIAFIYIGIDSIKHRKEQKELFKLEVKHMEESLEEWKQMIDGVIPMKDLMNIKMRINMWTNTIEVLSSRYSTSRLHSWDYLKTCYTYNEAKQDIEDAKRITGYKSQ